MSNAAVAPQHESNAAVAPQHVLLMSKLYLQSTVVGVGGKGALVEASVDVQPGESLLVMVGGRGMPNAGAFGGGGRGAGGGGGASDIRRGTFDTSYSCAFELTCGPETRVIVAPGGGGGGSCTFGSTTSCGGDGGLLGYQGQATNRTAANGVTGNAGGGYGATASAGGDYGGGLQVGGYGVGW